MKKTDNVTVRSYSINPTFTLSEFQVIQEHVVKNVGRMSNGKIPSFKWARELILREVGLLKSKMEISSPVKALGIHIKTSQYCPHGVLETKKGNRNV